MKYKFLNEKHIINEARTTLIKNADDLLVTTFSTYPMSQFADGVAVN